MLDRLTYTPPSGRLHDRGRSLGSLGDKPLYDVPALIHTTSSAISTALPLAQDAISHLHVDRIFSRLVLRTLALTNECLL